MARVVVVNDRDEPIGLKERSEITTSDIYRVSVLWLTNSRGKILLAKRALSKEVEPGVWGVAVAGTVDEGEDYDDNMVKEIKEEISLDIPLSDLKKGPKRKSRNRRGGEYFVQWYFFTLDKAAADFVIQEAEVAEVKWVTGSELREAIEADPEQFVAGAKSWEQFVSF